MWESESRGGWWLVLQTGCSVWWSLHIICFYFRMLLWLFLQAFERNTCNRNFELGSRLQFVLGHSVNLSHSLGEHIVDEEQRQLQGPMERPWEATEDPEAKIVYHLDSRWQLCCCLLVAILCCPSHVFLSIFILKCLSLNLLVATFQIDSFCKLTLESQLAHGIRSPLYFGYISKPNHYTYSVFIQSLTATHGYSTVQTQLVLQCSKNGSAKLLFGWRLSFNVLKKSQEAMNFLNFWSSFTLPKDYCCSFSDLDALKNGIFQVPCLAQKIRGEVTKIYDDIWQVEQAICHITSQILFVFCSAPEWWHDRWPSQGTW